MVEGVYRGIRLWNFISFFPPVWMYRTEILCHCNILQNVERVIFVGNYLCGNKMSMQMLAYAMDYWSRNTIKALFLEHEGYFGALGSMLFHLDPDCTQ